MCAKQERYTDSILVSKEAADRRVAELKAEFARRGLRTDNENGPYTFWAWNSPAELADAKLAPEPEKRQ